MRIVIAKESGFCFGVRRALDKINSLTTDRSKQIYVLGELIHNRDIINNLKKKGIVFIDNLKKIKKTKKINKKNKKENKTKEKVLVISAHGVSDKVLAEAKKRGLKIVDTTCPLVRRVHHITKKLEKDGYRIIIFADKTHTETKGIKGNLSFPIIIEKLSELNKINIENSRNKKYRKYALVFQTTQDLELLEKINSLAKKKIKNIKVIDTICSATKARQKSAKELARKVDMMLVVGGYNSANTKRLRQICSRIVKTKHIENENQLKKSWFKGKKRIGITAGASTPEETILKVVKNINLLQSKNL